MKQLILKYKNYILIILGIFTLIFFLLGKKSPALPQITSSIPPASAQNVELRAVPTYQISTPFTLSDLTVSSTPNFDFQLTEKVPGTVHATHSLAFQPATTYTLVLSYQNKVILTHSFTTIKSQEDPLLIQNMKDELARDYPLAQKLPLNTSQHRAVYSAPLTLEITIKNPNLTSQEAIDDIKSWVKKNGGDAEAHKYTISSGSASVAPSSDTLSTSPLR